MASFSERLKELRKEKKLTQKQLADILFIDKSSICKYETGVNYPENRFLKQMADFFDVSTDYLLGRTEKRNNETSKESIEKANDILSTFEECGIDIYNINIDILKALLESYKILDKKK